MVILKGMPAWCAGWAKEQYHSGVIIRQPQKSFYVPFRSVVAYYTREISASASLETTMEGTVFSQHCINNIWLMLHYKKSNSWSFSICHLLFGICGVPRIRTQAPDYYTNYSSYQKGNKSVFATGMCFEKLP